MRKKRSVWKRIRWFLLTEIVTLIVIAIVAQVIYNDTKKSVKLEVESRMDFAASEAKGQRKESADQLLRFTFLIQELFLGEPHWQYDKDFEDFTPDTYPVTSPVYTIYDNQMTSTINVTTEYGAANSTLVLETYADDAAATDNDDVIIAIELINNTESDFIGADGVIPDGGKFYMVGKLTAANATTTTKKVFLKDYITTAQLNILDLTKAYNTIPDLRTPTLEIGLSVDLSWTEGTTYTVDL